MASFGFLFLSFLELELELILSQMAQKPMLRGEVGARALRVLSFPPPLSGGLDRNSSNSGRARLSSGVAPPSRGG